MSQQVNTIKYLKTKQNNMKTKGNKRNNYTNMKIMTLK